MAISPKVREAVEWYAKNRGIYEALAKRVESILQEILDYKKINYYSINSRPKTVESYKQKASRGKYKEPRTEIMDMAGIRVITYTDSDAKEVYEIVKDVFNIQPEHSIDKTKELGINRVGYRSIHCVGTLGKQRLKLPENKIFKDMCFEIQIRTILQHAWAEFEHDRNYKFSGILPKNLRRRLSLVAGNLESADREFDHISKAIDAYAEDVGRRTEMGDLDVPINSTSLREFMVREFEPLVEKGVDPTIYISHIRQIKNMGINTLREFDEIIPDDYIEVKAKYSDTLVGEFFGSIIIDILIIHDVDAYFKKAWKEAWHAIDKSDVRVYTHYGIDFRKYATRHHIEVMTGLI